MLNWLLEYHAAEGEQLRKGRWLNALLLTLIAIGTVYQPGGTGGPGPATGPGGASWPRGRWSCCWGCMD